jgi:hypothetical protein
LHTKRDHAVPPVLRPRFVLGVGQPFIALAPDGVEIVEPDVGDQAREMDVREATAHRVILS